MFLINSLQKKTLPGVHKKDYCLNLYRKKGAPHYTCTRGSLTIEASILIPIIVAFLAFILFYFRIMQIQLIVQSALEETGRSLAIISSKELEEEVSDIDYAVLAQGKLYLQLKDEELLNTYVKAGALGVNLWKSEFDRNYILLDAEYMICFPIGFFGKTNFLINQKTRFRKWNGEYDIAFWEDSKDVVYVTKYGEVYHRHRNCTFLDLSIQLLSYYDLRERRNYSGERYKPCAICYKNEVGSNMVYITNYGDKYHSKIDCSGLKRIIYSKKISEVGGMAPCRKCWK